MGSLHRVGFSVALLLFAACGDDGEAEAAASTEAEATEGAGEEGAPEQEDDEVGQGATFNEVGGVGWEAPADFRPKQPSSMMRKGEYVFLGRQGEQPALMAIFYFGRGAGGDIDDNLQRWIGQFDQPDGTSSFEAADVTEREIRGMPVHVIDLSGIYDGGMNFGPIKVPPQPNSRLLGAIVEGPEGPVFFKMVGPQPVMERAEPLFREFVDSVRPSSN